MRPGSLLYIILFGATDLFPFGVGSVIAFTTGWFVAPVLIAGLDARGRLGSAVLFIIGAIGVSVFLTRSLFLAQFQLTTVLSTLPMAMIGFVMAFSFFGGVQSLRGATEKPASMAVFNLFSILTLLVILGIVETHVVYRITELRIEFTRIVADRFVLHLSLAAIFLYTLWSILWFEPTRKVFVLASPDLANKTFLELSNHLIKSEYATAGKVEFDESLLEALETFHTGSKMHTAYSESANLGIQSFTIVTGRFLRSRIRVSTLEYPPGVTVENFQKLLERTFAKNDPTPGKLDEVVERLRESITGSDELLVVVDGAKLIPDDERSADYWHTVSAFVGLLQETRVNATVVVAATGPLMAELEGEAAGGQFPQGEEFTSLVHEELRAEIEPLLNQTDGGFYPIHIESEATSSDERGANQQVLATNGVQPLLEEILTW